MELLQSISSQLLQSLHPNSSSHINIYSRPTEAHHLNPLHQLAQHIIQEVGYRPSLYCRIDRRGQLQTATQFCLRNLSRLVSHVVQHPKMHVHFERELITLPDGGTVGIDWASSLDDDEDTPRLHSASPVILFLHGLIGDSQSEYIFHLSRKFLHIGYRVGVMIARGCGGMKLTSPNAFTGRRTADIRAVIMTTRNRYPSAKIFWMGFSLGAAASLQYLEDYGDSTEVTAAVCVCPPWSLRRDNADLWSIMMTMPIKAYVLEHYETLKVLHGKCAQFTPADIIAVKDIGDFDRTFFRVHGGGCYKEGLEHYGPILFQENYQCIYTKKNNDVNIIDGDSIDDSAVHTIVEISNNDSVSEDISTATNTPIHPRYEYKSEEEDEIDGQETMEQLVSNSLMQIGKYFQLQYGEDKHNHLHDKQHTNHQHHHHHTHNSTTHNSHPHIDVEYSDPLEEDSDVEGSEQSSTGYESDDDEYDDVDEDNQIDPASIIYTSQYHSVDHYYEDVSPIHRAHLVTTPTLAISALDDPIINASGIPTKPDQLGKGLVVVCTPFGGHLAFPEGLAPVTDAWTDRVALNWFQRFL
jgi:predicted alpha/beta-fold hydrolase